MRADKKWKVEYMRFNELMMDTKRSGMRLGRYMERVAQVRAFRDEFQPNQLARITFVSPELLQTILNTIDAHPDWNDEEVAEHIDFE